ncbi:ribonuclease HII [Candidatus Aerophobetes bacterium]|nr:ribonuclease HII [Candidatus Aerophobetes bacterium]
MQELVMGIDEAGRGPVIGPMVVCGIMTKKGCIPELVQMGVKDSKLLSPSRRERLKTLIERIAVRWKLIKIPPSQIDRYSMNFLHLKAIAQLIDEFSPYETIIDCPTSCPPSFERKIKALIKVKDTKLVVENFADKRYSIVSAASILAKVARDEEIKNISSLYSDIGSGYPSDKRTIEFIKRCLREDKVLPEIIRKKWKTTKNLIAEQENKDE